MTTTETAARLFGAGRRSGEVVVRRMQSMGTLAPAVLYLGVVYALPLVSMALLSVGRPDYTLEHYTRFLSAPGHIQVFTRTFLISFLTTLTCVAVGYPLSYALTRVAPRMRNLLLIAVLAPWIISTLVRTFAWMLLLGRRGPINELLLTLGVMQEPLQLLGSSLAVYLGLVYVQLPLAILPMYSVMDRIDRRLVLVAQASGANPLQSFTRVYFPLSLPGVYGGGLLVFIGSLGVYITPLLLGGPGDLFISNLIDVQVRSLLNWPFASALGFILLLITTAVFLVYNRLTSVDRAFGGGAQ